MRPPILTLRGQLGGRTLSFPLGGGDHEIGRADACTVRLDEASVSRRHARVSVRGEEVVLVDLGSSNGTRLNGAVITGTAALSAGDVIDLGNVQLAVDGNGNTSLFLEQTRVREGLSVNVDELRRAHTNERDKKAYLFRILAEAGELLARPLTPEKIFDPLLKLVEKALQPERAFLLLQEEDDDEPRIVASRVHGGVPGGMILSHTLLARVIEQRTAFLTEDASRDERLQGGDSIVGAGTRSAMAAPLFDNERVIGLLYADSSDPGVHYDRDELQAFVLLANVVAVAITHARFHALEEERRRLNTELVAARRIMARLLPREMPTLPGLNVTAHLVPCEEVAGDLYDVRLLPDGRLLLVVGDVAGKGLSAALLVAALLPAIRIVADECADLGRLASRINDQIFDATEAVRFATLFLGLLDPRTGRLDFVNAGHNPPLMMAPGGLLTALPPSGPPVGMVPDLEYPVNHVTLKPGCRLVFYSDGLTEAMNGDEEMYGEERLHELLAGCPGCTQTDLQRRVLDDVATFTGGAPPIDDVTLVLVERTSTAPG